MTQPLTAILTEASRRPAVVADLSALVDAEVAAKKGMSGMALKGGYGVVRKINAQFVPHAIDSMLPAFAAQLEPFHTAAAEVNEPLSAQMRRRPDDVAEALLGVTDARAARSRRDSVKKVYAKLRPQGHKHVTEALPRLGVVLDKHVSA